MSLLPSRQSWIDVLRGTSVLMVILLHAHSAAFNPHVERDIDYTNQLARLIDMLNSAAAPFRMEMMFLLSGLFVSSGLKKGATQYLTGKISNILHPFILWSLIIFALKQLGSVLAKGMPIDWSPLVEIPLGYSSLTWFLYFLFGYYLIVPLLRGVNAILVGTSCILLAMALPEALQNLS